MARGLGELIVRLGLDASEFTSGLTKSERDAKRFADEIDRGISKAANAAAIGIAAIGAAAVVAFAALDNLVKQAAQFKDLEEKTGANAEALASFSVAAQVAGTNIASVAEATIKLTKNLTGVDDESKAAGAALAALNIPIEEFKTLDPATQMEVVAKALAGFQDSAAKTAVALALFGKSGPEILPFLRELATGSGRVVILNQELIKQADDYADKQARARAELNLYAQVVASQMLPALTALTDTTKEFIKQLIGIDGQGKALRDNNSVAEFAKVAAQSLAEVVDVGDAVVRVFQAVGISLGAQLAIREQALHGDLAGIKSTVTSLLSDLDKLASKQQFSSKLSQRLAQDAATSALRNQEDRGFTPAGKPLVFGGPDKTAAALKERTSEAQRYLEQLEKQLQGTLELNTEETALVAIYELQKNALSGLTPAIEALILDNARQIDAAKELKRVQEEQRRAEEEASRIRQRISQDTTRRIESIEKEAQHIRDSNDAIQQQIEFLRGGEVGLRAYTDAKLAKAIAENLDKEAMLANAGATEAEIDAVHKVTQALQQTQSQLKQLDLAKTFAADKKAAEDFANSISDSFSNAFEGFITGTKSAKEAFKQFTGDIESMLVRLALKNLMNKILGLDSTGPDAFSVIAKLLGSLGGAGAAGGIGYGSAGSAIPIGPYPYANGTNWHPGGMALVGERGPELLNLPRGAQVIPLDKMRKRSVTNVFNVNVLPGATTQSVMQTKAMLRDAVMSSARDR